MTREDRMKGDRTECMGLEGTRVCQHHGTIDTGRDMLEAGYRCEAEGEKWVALSHNGS